MNDIIIVREFSISEYKEIENIINAELINAGSTFTHFNKITFTIENSKLLLIIYLRKDDIGPVQQIKHFLYDESISAKKIKDDIQYFLNNGGGSDVITVQDIRSVQNERTRQVIILYCLTPQP